MGTTYGIVTPYTSLIVLESLDQYVEYKIAPPKSEPALLVKYKNIIDKQALLKTERQTETLKNIILAWDHRVDWHKKEFKYPDNFKYTSPKKADASGQPIRDLNVQNQPILQQATPEFGEAADSFDGEDLVSMVEQQVVAMMSYLRMLVTVWMILKSKEMLQELIMIHY